jgi:hypothetical protein
MTARDSAVAAFARMRAGQRKPRVLANAATRECCRIVHGNLGLGVKHVAPLCRTGFNPSEWGCFKMDGLKTSPTIERRSLPFSGGWSSRPRDICREQVPPPDLEAA